MYKFLRSRFLNYFTFFFSLFSLSLFVFIHIALSSVSLKELTGLDIRAFYTSGLMVHKGVTENLYDLTTQYHWQKTIFPLHSQNNLMPFFNPPFVALLLSPLTMLSLKNAYITLSFLNTGVILICLYFLLKENNKTTNTMQLILFLVFSFFYFPIIITIYQGQLSFFLFFSVIMSWYFFKREKHFLAGASLALLAIKPHLLLVPLILLIWKKQWRSLIALFFSVSILLFISLYVVGIPGLIQYFHLLFVIPSFGNAYAVHPQIEPTLRGFLQLVFHTNKLSAIMFPFILGLLITATLFYFVYKGTWDTKTERFDTQWSILLLIIIFTSIHTNYHDLILLLFPCSILLKSINKNIYLYIAIFSIDAVFYAFIAFPSLLAPVIAGILGIFICKFYRENAFAVMLSPE